MLLIKGELNLYGGSFMDKRKIKRREIPKNTYAYYLAEYIAREVEAIAKKKKVSASSLVEEIFLDYCVANSTSPRFKERQKKDKLMNLIDSADDLKKIKKKIINELND